MHQPETALQSADGKPQPALLRGQRRGEQIAEPPGFRFGLADDEHLLAHAGFVQFVADAIDVAAEPLDRFDLQAGKSSPATPKPPPKPPPTEIETPA